MISRFVLLTLALLSLGSQLRAEAAPTPPTRLVKVILADTEAKAMGVPADMPSQVLVAGLPLLTSQEFAESLAPFFGQNITIELVNAIGGVVRQYGIKKDRILNLVIPQQDSSQGILRMVVITGTYRDIAFRGNRWFSAKNLEQNLGIKSGEEISISRLDAAVNWANNNPYRRIQVMLNPVQDLPGKTDLIVGVDERIPLRLIASYDDTGNHVIGKNHYSGMVQYGNVFGRDHQATYQFITTDRSKVYQGHSLDYRIPLPWKHVFQATGSYSKARPSFNEGLFQQDATNLGGSVRYTVPVRGGDNPIEWYGLVDFKESNNNLEYGGFQVIASKTDLFHLGTGLTMVRREKNGGWLFGVNLMLSPGGINGRNSTETLEAARIGAVSTYVYGTLSLQRVTKLGAWDIVTRAYGQLSSDNLLGSEQLMIGGSASVRGYEERVFAGEQGVVFSNEVMLPPWRRALPRFLKNKPPAEARLVIFQDAATVAYRHRYPSDIPFSALASAGLGLRIAIPGSFNVSFDYGWQLTRLPYAQPAKHRGHVKASLAF